MSNIRHSSAKGMADKAYYPKNREHLLKKAAEYRKKNRNKVNAKVRELNELNYDRYYAVRRAWIERNRERSNNHKKKYGRNNPRVKRFSTANRRAKLLQATPKWLTPEQRKEIRDIYLSCPDGYEVDHKIPLQGENVSGLHVPWNLQHLTIRENRAKNNKVAA